MTKSEVCECIRKTGIIPAVRVGADGIGIGRELIPRQSIEMREGERIRELARRFLKFVQDARQRLVPARESAGHSMY